MGSYLYTEESDKDTVYVEHLNYDTKDCLPGCREKLRLEGIDTVHEYALQKSSLFTNAVLLYCDKSSNHDLFYNRDIVRVVIHFLIQYSVQERIEKAPTLSIPWCIHYYKTNDYYTVMPPNRSLCKDNKHSSTSMIKNQGKIYFIYNSFWLDDVYESLTCPCPLRADRIARKRAQREEHERHIERQRCPVTVLPTRVPYCKEHDKWGYRCSECTGHNKDY